MAQRLSLAIACASLYFLSFLPLDIYHYFQAGRHPFALLWVGVNIVRLASLLGCWGLLRWGRSPGHVTASFLLTSLTLNGFQRGFDTLRGLTIPGLELDPDLFSWALIFIAQATLVPVRWRLHLLTQIVTFIYVFVVNPGLGVDVMPADMAPLNLYMNLFWIFGICNISVYFYDRLAQTVFQTHRQLQITNRELGRTNRQLEEAQTRSERLLLNILPSTIATQLKSDTSTIAENFSEVTVLFADIVGFTQLSQTLSPIALVALLNQVFSEFDQLTDRYALEKIKTIGDAYMVVAGLPEHREDHASAIADMALDMQAAIAQLNRQTPYRLDIRVGIHTGPVVAGVIGLKKFAYDLWGDTVNMASRLESHGVPGKIQVSTSTYGCLKRHYHLQQRGTVDIKGKGPIETYWLLGK